MLSYSPYVAVAGEFPVYFVIVYIVGLVAAVSIGLIAWFNSKRPVGWETSERPNFIPDLNLDSEENPSPPPESESDEPSL